MVETKKSSTADAAKKDEPKKYPLKKPMRYGGAVQAVGYPVVLSDKCRARLTVKGYV
jgi:hypothetical protein